MSVDSASMEPGVRMGDRIFASPIPYGIFIPFTDKRVQGVSKPERGDLVVLNPPYADARFSAKAFFESFINFISFQQASLYSNYAGKRIYAKNIKRIIGIPGDTIKLSNFIAFIKPKDSLAFLQEDAIIKNAYKPRVDNGDFPKGWQSVFPFSGNASELTLKENEYFVLGDNRMEANDSRSWGPIQFSRIASKVVLRWWPFTKIAGL
jgi:signal peptidase I